MTPITPAMRKALLKAWEAPEEEWKGCAAIQSLGYRIVPVGEGRGIRVPVEVDREGWWGNYKGLHGRVNLAPVGPIPAGHALCSGTAFAGPSMPSVVFLLIRDVPWNEAVAALNATLPEAADRLPPFEAVEFGAGQA